MTAQNYLNRVELSVVVVVVHVDGVTVLRAVGTSSSQNLENSGYINIIAQYKSFVKERRDGQTYMIYVEGCGRQEAR